MTAGPPRWLDDREQRAWSSLQLLHLRLDAALARQLLRDSGMSLQDYVVLVALTAAPDGRMRAFELGRMLGWEKSRLSHHLTRMSRRGLVDRELCEVDRRGAWVVVTKKGRKAIEAAAPGHVAEVRRLFIDLLTPRELDTIAAVAERVLAVLDADEAIDTPSRT